MQNFCKFTHLKPTFSISHSHFYKASTSVNLLYMFIQIKYSSSDQSTPNQPPPSTMQYFQIQNFSHFSRTTIRAPNQTIFIALQASLDSIFFLIKHLPTPIVVCARRKPNIAAIEPEFLNRKPFEQFRQLAGFEQVLDRLGSSDMLPSDENLRDWR